MAYVQAYIATLLFGSSTIIKPIYTRCFVQQQTPSCLFLAVLVRAYFSFLDRFLNAWNIGCCADWWVRTPVWRQILAVRASFKGLSVALAGLDSFFHAHCMNGEGICIATPTCPGLSALIRACLSLDAFEESRLPAGLSRKSSGII